MMSEATNVPGANWIVLEQADLSYTGHLPFVVKIAVYREGDVNDDDLGILLGQWGPCSYLIWRTPPLASSTC